PFRTAAVRLAVVVSFLLFHLVGLGLFLELGPYPWVCAVAWLALLPGAFWDWLAARGPLPPGLPRGPRARPAAADAPGHGPAAPLLLNVAAACFLVYVFLCNVRTVDVAPWSRLLPRQADFIASTFAVDQQWDMFAPCPLKDDGWYVVQGNLKNGSSIDLFR